MKYLLQYCMQVHVKHLNYFIFAYFLHQFRSNVAACGYKQVLFIEWETLLDRSEADASFELLINLQEYILPIIYRKCHCI